MKPVASEVKGFGLLFVRYGRHEVEQLQQRADRRILEAGRGWRGGQGAVPAERIGPFRSYLRSIRTDQGPEFTSRAFMAWAHARGVNHLINDAGKPTQNAYVESFNGKFHDECLNEQWFEALYQARQGIARRRRDYSEVRPHSAVRRIPPAQFAALHRQRAGDARQSTEIN